MTKTEFIELLAPLPDELEIYLEEEDGWSDPPVAFSVHTVTVCDIRQFGEKEETKTVILIN